jgi:uncharacterized radical SAM superfamily Fe-S cluster-containing enzyme
MSFKLDGIDSNSFHDVVMKYKGNVTSPRLRDLVLSVNQTTFQQLKDESIEVLLPSVIKLLNDPSKLKYITVRLFVLQV